MAFVYHEVVPWGRSYDEYLRMFDLDAVELGLRILGCGDGPASFNCGMHARGQRMVSADPLYQLTRDQIAQRIEETYAQVMEQTEREKHRFVWDSIGSVEALGRTRMQSMQAFLADYAAGQAQGRYLPAALPRLPFRAQSFELALCSHLLLFYAQQLDREFHRAALRELCRVASEVRIFPIVDVNGNPSPHLELGRELEADGYTVEIRTVPYEFQRGGNRMLRITDA